MKYIFFFSILIIVLSSCTMEKKIYSRGYHVEWSKHKNTKTKSPVKGEYAARTKTNQKTVSDIDLSDVAEHSKKESLYASSDNSGLFFNSEYSAKYIKEALIRSRKIKMLADSCDNIILRNGEQIKGKVTEIDLENIKYKKCENLNGPVHYIPKSEVFMIQYANGTSENFKEVKKEVKTYILPPPDPDVIYTRTEGFGLAGFFASFLSLIPLLIFQNNALFIYLFPCIYVALTIGIICTVLGIIGIIRGAINPDKFRGKGFGIVSLILGLLIILGCIVALTVPLLFL